jgi:phosphohistidine phosphatase
MKTLLVMRHAKSSWREANIADHDRPLNKRGKRDAPRMGQLMREESLMPDLILTSSAKRALSTAKLAAEVVGYEGEILVSRDLYAAGPDEIIELLCELPEVCNTVLIVGHNPGFEELVDTLTDEAPGMPTAALACIELDIDEWEAVGKEASGSLVNLWLPRNLT